jgi:hypothetical protein
MSFGAWPKNARSALLLEDEDVVAAGTIGDFTAKWIAGPAPFPNTHPPLPVQTFIDQRLGLYATTKAGEFTRQKVKKQASVPPTRTLI